MEAFRSVRPDLDDMPRPRRLRGRPPRLAHPAGQPGLRRRRGSSTTRAQRRRPALIVRAADAADVARTVLVARESGLELSVRGGGHSLAGYGTNDGGIVLDLGAMKGLHIDPDRRLAWAQPGLTAGEYTVAAAAHGLATPFGDTGSVGIAGLTLGGGIGWLARKYGLAIDALEAVEIVTADGRVVTASEESHPDLFWAVRGGGGNFGVVTRFQFRLYPVGEIFGGALFMPATRDVLRSLVPIASSAPEELTTISFLMAPAARPVRPGRAGRHAVAGRHVRVVPAIRPTARPRIAAVPRGRDAARRHGDADAVSRASTSCLGRGRAARADASIARASSSTLDDDAIDAILDAMAAPSSPAAMVQLRVLGGAMARVPADATAFAHRDAAVMALIITALRGSGDRAGPARLDRGAPRGARGQRRRRLLELPRGRGRRADPGGLPGRHVRAAGRHQAPLRPDEPVPPEPEHPRRRRLA